MSIAHFKHLFILSTLALLALGGIVFDRPVYTEGVSYHGANVIFLNGGQVIRVEERLIIGDTLSIAMMEKAQSNVSYASLVARTVSSGRRSLEVEIQETKSTRTHPTAELSEVPDVIFGRQYSLVKGAPLNLEFLPTRGRTRSVITLGSWISSVA